MCIVGRAKSSAFDNCGVTAHILASIIIVYGSLPCNETAWLTGRLYIRLRNKPSTIEPNWHGAITPAGS